MIKRVSWILVLGLAGTAAAATPSHQSSAAHHARTATTKPETISWEAIDTNHDGLIQPEEMERYLKAEWAKAKPPAPAAHHS